MIAMKKMKFKNFVLCVCWWISYLLWFAAFLHGTAVIDYAPCRPLCFLLSLFLLLMDILFVKYSSIDTSKSYKNMRTYLIVQFVGTIIVYFREDIAAIVSAINA